MGGRVVFLVLCLFASGALAQGITFGNATFGNVCVSGNFAGLCGPEHAATGNADLDRAVSICEAHEHDGSTMITTNPPSIDRELEPAYRDGCVEVFAAWDRSDTARREREAKAAAEADKRWLDQYAGKLP